MSDVLPITLSEDELHALTGYRMPSKQLEELHRQGFVRTRRHPLSGRVVLERPHFEAVSRGTYGRPEKPDPTALPRGVNFSKVR
jgi:hypothetical protein